MAKKPNKVYDGPKALNKVSEPAQNNAPESKKSKKKTELKGSDFLTGLYTIGVFVIGMILFQNILGKECKNLKDFWSVVLDPFFLLFTGACILMWVYGIIRKIDQLGKVNFVLTIIFGVLVLILFIPKGQDKVEKFYSKEPPQEKTKMSTTPLHVSTDYDDAGSLDTGLYKFNLPDSGSETSWITVKKNTDGWKMNYSECSHYKFLVVFSDGDTIKTWIGGYKESWGLSFKIIAMAPMTPTDSLRLIVKAKK